MIFITKLFHLTAGRYCVSNSDVYQRTSCFRRFEVYPLTGEQRDSSAARNNRSDEERATHYNAFDTSTVPLSSSSSQTRYARSSSDRYVFKNVRFRPEGDIDGKLNWYQLI